MQMEKKDVKILRQVFHDNRDGFQRLAEEKPAEERRSVLKKFQSKVKEAYRHITGEKEEKIGYITL